MRPLTCMGARAFVQVLKHMVVLNAPTVVNALYAMVKPLLPERTRRKIIFVSGKPEKYLPTLIEP